MKVGRLSVYNFRLQGERITADGRREEELGESNDERLRTDCESLLKVRARLVFGSACLSSKSVGCGEGARDAKKLRAKRPETE